MEKAYPRFREEFTLADLPEAIAGEIRRAAGKRYQNALGAGRHVVLHHLQSANSENPDTPENWRLLRTWLAKNPDELKAWRVLATVLARLQSLEGIDPVLALDDFLGQERFELVLRRVMVEMSEDLKLRPAGKLSVHPLSGGEQQSMLEFEVLGEERRDLRRRTITYTFQPTAGMSMSYRPGDTLWMDLLVKRGDDSEAMLTWAANRSQAFQFERLVLPPRLLRKDQPNTDGELMTAIHVEVIPETGVPKVPDLLPTVVAKP
jgi:hypothetical protein